MSNDDDLVEAVASAMNDHSGRKVMSNPPGTFLGWEKTKEQLWNDQLELARAEVADQQRELAKLQQRLADEQAKENEA